MGGNAWERRSQTRHFYNLAFSGFKERLFRANARSLPGKIVLFMETQLVNLNLVKKYRGRCKIERGPQIFTEYQGFFYHFYYLKIITL